MEPDQHLGVKVQDTIRSDVAVLEQRFPTVQETQRTGPMIIWFIVLYGEWTDWLLRL